MPKRKREQTHKTKGKGKQSKKQKKETYVLNPKIKEKHPDPRLTDARLNSTFTNPDDVKEGNYPGAEVRQKVFGQKNKFMIRMVVDTNQDPPYVPTAYPANSYKRYL